MFFFEKNLLIFDIENWLWKYNFGTFWRTIIHCRIVLKKFPLSVLILGQKSCILGPIIFKITQLNWHYPTSHNGYSYIFQEFIPFPGKWLKYLMRGDADGRITLWKIPDTPECASMQLKTKNGEPMSVLSCILAHSGVSGIFHGVILPFASPVTDPHQTPNQIYYQWTPNESTVPLKNLQKDPQHPIIITLISTIYWISRKMAEIFDAGWRRW